MLTLAGCAGFLPGAREDPGDDPLGWEDGYWYDDPLSVDTSDGLNESEREAVVARTMARVERIRGLEFEEPVPVEVISREEYRARRANRTESPDTTYNDWNDQVWEALFLVGENESFADRYDQVLGSSVLGFYSPSRDEIVIVSDSETPTLDRRTLSHELVHALQDQHFRLGANAETQDTQLAEDGLVEGDANFVEATYENRCSNGWSCVDRPQRSGGGGGGIDGVFLTIYTPYAEGPGLVSTLRERSGGEWESVNDAYDAFPASTEQVIHPERYPDEEPVEVAVSDRTRNGWERFDLDQTTDTVGEASIYAMFWDNDVLEEDGSPYDYESAPSEGWGGDTVVPYRKSTADGEQYGYVWKTAWDSPEDARQFHQAYLALLESHDAREVRDGVYVVESGPYADAFRVSRDGTTVTVVNAPTRGALGDVRRP